MDVIVKGLFQSSHAELVKKQVLKQLRISITNGLATVTCAQQKSLLNICIHYTLKGDEFEHREAALLLKDFLPICNSECYDKFTDKFIGDVIQGTVDSEQMTTQQDTNHHLRQTISIFRRIVFIGLLMDQFKCNSMNQPQLYIQVHVKTEVIRLLYDSLDHRDYAEICRFLLKHRNCMPSSSRRFAVCTLSIQAMSKFLPLDVDIPMMSQYMRDIVDISLLLQYLWTNDQITVFPSLLEIFKIISSNDSSFEPSNALGSLVQFIPPSMIDSTIEKVIHDQTVTDQQMMMALCRMVAWVGWPNAKQAHLWVLSFFEQLEAVKSIPLLVEVTTKTVKQVFNCLRFPMTRAPALNVLNHMLMSYQHSHDAFHCIVTLIPKMVSMIESEENPENEIYLKELSNLFHCMMELHSGFPELYGPILESTKKYRKPLLRDIKRALSLKQWSTHKCANAVATHFLSRSSSTGKAGLVNLGNTCYMNSVLQALFMINEFRCGILTMKSRNNSTALAYNLAETFSYLLLTQRVAYEPKRLVELSRPSWFVPGTQQDCSEYLKYLLDCLLEEENATRQRIVQSDQGMFPTDDALPVRGEVEQMSWQETNEKVHDASYEDQAVVERLFHGKIRSSIRCQSCNFISYRDETFVDFALPLNKAHERGGVEEREDTGGSIGSPTNASKPQEACEVTLGEGSSRAFVDHAEGEGNRRPVQAQQDVEEEEESEKRSHRLEDLFHDSLAEEYLIEDNRYHCSQCSSLQDAVKTTFITQLPTHLLLTLMRFTYNTKEHRRTKLLDHVEIPENVRVPLQKGNKFDSVEYTLSSVIVHSGTSADSGHYYCFAKQQVAGYTSWYLFNDSHVSSASFESIEDLRKFARDTPYVLLYTKSCNSDTRLSEGKEHIERSIYQAIEEDNQRFLKKLETLKQSSSSAKTRANILGWNNDDNPPPPPTCGGGGDGQTGPGLVC